MALYMAPDPSEGLKELRFKPQKPIHLPSATSTQETLTERAPSLLPVLPSPPREALLDLVMGPQCKGQLSKAGMAWALSRGKMGLAPSGCAHPFQVLQTPSSPKGHMQPVTPPVS